MRKIYYNHDGGVDDLVGLFLLLQDPNIELVGVGVVNGDCYVEPALSASLKIIEQFGHHQMIPVAESTSRPRNPFPQAWREQAFTIDALPILNNHYTHQSSMIELPAHEHLTHLLKDSDEPIDLVFVGPLTDLASVLKTNPSLQDKVNHLYWMGGTFLAEGNVQEPHHDGTAEWNAFWDPEAVAIVWQSNIDITMVGLESTNKVPLTNTIRFDWAQDREFPGIDFLGQAYSLVPPMAFIQTNSTYFLWDVLTVAYALNSNLAMHQTVNGKVVTHGVSQGRTYQDISGRPIQLVYDVHHDDFFEFITSLAKNVKRSSYDND
ncbi:MAG: nucleoside hydrolase [Aerococcus suis]|nr:nucleoside hydrolase [Aerococcus suis]MDY4647098.1 nucleoside hydrolase [Aerococcus suis]